jgi:RNA polymerase sigma-70 factor (ECF subfamily)
VKPLPCEEAALILRAKSGDAEAFDDLFRRYEAIAFRYACRISKDRERASDIVGVTFTKVYQGLWRFESASSFTSWLYRIIMNTHLDLKGKDEKLSVQSLVELPGIDGEHFQAFISARTIDPHTNAVTSELLTAIGTAIAGLSANNRATAIRFYVQSMSYSQMAEDGAQPLGTVKSRMHRANVELRRELAKQGATIW